MSITDALRRCAGVCVAWGANATGLQRPRDVWRLLQLHSRFPVQCLGLTRSGHPQHPLMLPSDRSLMAFPGVRG